MDTNYKILTESERKALMNDNKVCSREETIALICSYGTMTKEELIEKGHNMIKEAWEEKYGGL